MGKRRTGKLRTPTKRRPSETPPIFSIRIGHTLVDMLGPRHSMAEPPFFGDRQKSVFFFFLNLFDNYFFDFSNKL